MKSGSASSERPCPRYSSARFRAHVRVLAPQRLLHDGEAALGDFGRLCVLGRLIQPGYLGVERCGIIASLRPCSAGQNDHAHQHRQHSHHLAPYDPPARHAHPDANRSRDGIDCAPSMWWRQVPTMRPPVPGQGPVSTCPFVRLCGCTSATRPYSKFCHDHTCQQLREFDVDRDGRHQLHQYRQQCHHWQCRQQHALRGGGGRQPLRRRWRRRSHRWQRLQHHDRWCRQ